jgi:hypothetical protein
MLSGCLPDGWALQSGGKMVNYLYDTSQITTNDE